MRTTLRQHIRALSHYEALGISHHWATASLARLLGTALVMILNARHCWRCGGRGASRLGGGIAVCEYCAGLGLVVQTRRCA